MRRSIRIFVALAIVGAWFSAAHASDIRHRRPSTHWIPGFFEGDYAGVANINLLPDVIEATLEFLGARRTVEGPAERVLENLTPVRTLEKL